MNTYNANSNAAAVSRTALGVSDYLPHRALVIDDHPIVRHGLRRVLDGQEDLTVCGEAESMQQAAAAISAFNPDVLIVDISCQIVNGIELLRKVRACHPRLRVLVLSSLDETIYAERLLSAGANGYIMKDASSDQFLLALRCVLDGQTYVSKALGDNILRRLSAGTAPMAVDPIARLSGRELQILQMIGVGKSTRETAVSLHLSVKTVESHRQRIKRKLNLDTSTQLVRYALLGLAETPMRENTTTVTS